MGHPSGYQNALTSSSWEVVVWLHELLTLFDGDGVAERGSGGGGSEIVQAGYTSAFSRKQFDIFIILSTNKEALR